MTIIKVDNKLVNVDDIEYAEEVFRNEEYITNICMHSGACIRLDNTRLRYVLEQINNAQGGD